jgi:uncharacterized protein YndB with AHSA1/START domain
MNARSVTHSTFSIERIYDHAPARVFAAFADPDAKAQWFSGPPEWEVGEVSQDFRVGGREVNIGGPPGGPVSKFYGLYQDIVSDERIVFTYDMFLDDTHLSVSVTTIEFAPEGAGTKLTFTEQAAFLDGHEDPSLREEGTREALNALGAVLDRMNANT